MRKKNNTLTIFVVAGSIIIALALLLIPKNDTKLGGTSFLARYASAPNAMMIDVRTPAEFSAGHVDKAVNIDLENPSFGEEVKKLDPTKTYFVYCRSGNRSGQAVSVMMASGIKNIYELQGGIVSNAGTLPLVSVNNQ